jgi:hypothetical protein
MKTTRWFVLGMVAIGLLVASAAAPTPASAAAPPPPGQRIKLLAKTFAEWDGTHVFEPTTEESVIYDQTVKSEGGQNVMDILVSFMEVDDATPGGIQCLVDGVPCMNNGSEDFGDDIFGFPNGTVSFFDGGDDDIHVYTYNFCQTITKTKKNLHEVVLNLEALGPDIFITALDVEVTAARVKDDTLACAPGAVQGNLTF